MSQKNVVAGQKSGNNPSAMTNRVPPPSAPKPTPMQNNKPLHQHQEVATSTTCINPCKEKSKKNSPYEPLLGLIPRHIYNPHTKKILGFLSSEDLLLIALIFLFLESNDDDNPLLVLALVYVLLGDYIDLGDFSI